MDVSLTTEIPEPHTHNDSTIVEGSTEHATDDGAAAVTEPEVNEPVPEIEIPVASAGEIQNDEEEFEMVSSEDAPIELAEKYPVVEVCYL